MTINIKRIYDFPSPLDGKRILVDRLWPRGMSKERAQLHLWLKDAAPGQELRKCFNHKPERFNEFRRLYMKELEFDHTHREAVKYLCNLAEEGDITLLYAAKDNIYNHAAVLKQWLERSINTVLNTKGEIRKYILEIRDKIDPEQRAEMDNKIYEKLTSSSFYQNSRVIFAFVSFKSEVDTKRIINRALGDNKTVCVPKIKSKEIGMEIFKINSLDDLTEGYYGILEPNESCHKISSSDIDFILMPGVAFDIQGGRIGYGGGFYDRFLTSLDKEVDKIALAYDFQVLNEVSMEESDVRIDGIITEKEYYKCKG